MSAQLITGIVFLALLLVFLGVAYFVPSRASGQDKILRVLSTLCAGFAGAILPGGINVQGTLQWSSTTTLSVSAVGALGFATLVWLTWRSDKAVAPPGVRVTFPESTTFAQAAELVAKLAKEPAALEGFTPQQEAQYLKTLFVRADSFQQAFERLGQYTGLKEFPPYTVLHLNGQYTLKAQN